MLLLILEVIFDDQVDAFPFLAGESAVVAEEAPLVLGQLQVLGIVSAGGMADKVIHSGAEVVGEANESTDVGLEFILFVSEYGLLGYIEIICNILLAYAFKLAKRPQILNHKRSPSHIL